MAPLGPMLNFYVPILRCRLYIYIYMPRMAMSEVQYSVYSAVLTIQPVQ